MQKYQNVIIDAAGNSIPSVTVTVYTAGTTTPATLFSDNGLTAKANPYVTDALGNIVFYAANGRYDVKLTKTGYTFGTDLYDISLFDSVDYTPATTNEAAINNLRLIKSGANLTLERVGGSLININGSIRSMTTAPTLATTALEASHLYYIYAAWSGTDVTLSAVETTYAIDATSGRAEKSGDTLYRLVGMAYTTAGVAWSDTAAARLVMSYNNRKPIQAYTSFASARGTTSATYAELTSSERLPILSWAGAVPLTFCGSVLSNVAVSSPGTAICIDGAGVASGVLGTIPSSGYYAPVTVAVIATVADGYHYASIFGLTDGGGTAAWSAGSSLQALLYG